MKDAALPCAHSRITTGTMVWEATYSARQVVLRRATSNDEKKKKKQGEMITLRDDVADHCRAPDERTYLWPRPIR